MFITQSLLYSLFLLLSVKGNPVTSEPAEDTAVSKGWNFVQNGTTGILALELMVVSPTLLIMFDRAENNPMMINGHPAWAGLWDLETNTASPLNAITDTFCASGSFLSNGTMVSV